jgi:hypothetical protein
MEDIALFRTDAILSTANRLRILKGVEEFTATSSLISVLPSFPNPLLNPLA